ncbi:hypothetical protein JEV20_16615 [Pseudomonas aeruginosa]|nr:hypothetical protein [Pseudomonas aeruginosa]
MKKFLFGVTAVLISSAAMAQVEERSIAKACIGYAQKQLKGDPEVADVFNQVVLASNDVVVNRYDRLVGKQHVATEVVISLHSKQEEFGKLLCLLDQDKPIYQFFIPQG